MPREAALRLADGFGATLQIGVQGRAHAPAMRPGPEGWAFCFWCTPRNTIPVVAFSILTDETGLDIFDLARQQQRKHGRQQKGIGKRTASHTLPGLQDTGEQWGDLRSCPNPWEKPNRGAFGVTRQAHKPGDPSGGYGLGGATTCKLWGGELTPPPPRFLEIL